MHYLYMFCPMTTFHVGIVGIYYPVSTEKTQRLRGDKTYWLAIAQ